jgi:hypothetical protein
MENSADHDERPSLAPSSTHPVTISCGRKLGNQERTHDFQYSVE